MYGKEQQWIWRLAEVVQKSARIATWHKLSPNLKSLFTALGRGSLLSAEGGQAHGHRFYFFFTIFPSLIMQKSQIIINTRILICVIDNHWSSDIGVILSVNLCVSVSSTPHPVPNDCSRCLRIHYCNQPVGGIYLCDSDETTTTRAGAERRSTSCRHWTSRKWPRWQIWKVDSRPSSVRLHGWVHTAALHTRMCRGLLWKQQKIKHAYCWWTKAIKKWFFSLSILCDVEESENMKRCLL